MIVQEGEHLKDYGKMAVLQDDLSPIQVGSTGVYDNRAFTVLGRIKVAWEGGFWNEWFLNFGDDSGWIGEAQGFYGISFEQTKELDKLPKRAEMKRGRRVQLGKSLLTVDDIKTAQIFGSEGELPFVPGRGREFLSVDLGGANSEFGTITYSDDGVSVYLGKYVDFENLKFRNLRALDGW